MLKKILISTLIVTEFLTAPIQAETNACDPTAECDDDASTTKEGFEEITMDDALNYFREGKSGILFFGFESCPWCKEARPILKKVAKAQKKDIYYVKVRDDDHNLLYTDEQREELSQYIGKYMSKNKEEDNKLWLYVPLVVAVKDGKAIGGHQGTVKSHDATKRKMTKKEKKKLTKTYMNLLKKDV